MQITMRGSILVAAIGVATLCLGVPASHAGTYGDQKWCAVTNDGAAAINWDCEYETVADCQPAIIGGNRGYCAVNPYYRPPEPAPPPAPQR